jgi:hypothetical protein
MRSKDENAPVRSKASTSVGTISINGTPITPLKPGETRAINGGVLQYAIRSNDSFYGTENEGLQVILFQDNVVIDLANVNGQIFFR